MTTRVMNYHQIYLMLAVFPKAGLFACFVFTPTAAYLFSVLLWFSVSSIPVPFEETANFSYIS
ncbi:hypothetical protein [Pantoea sp. KPR_PJ]|uniref:hypothetical protein n=1 Tax=Pantoea sp. KPR_PJ TaxID=2738375 RepID=UPI00352764BD